MQPAALPHIGARMREFDVQLSESWIASWTAESAAPLFKF